MPPKIFKKKVFLLKCKKYWALSIYPFKQKSLIWNTTDLNKHFFFNFEFSGASALGGQKRTKFMRQKTISGDSFGSGMFTRAISRTYTFTSNASSSIPMDEWKRIFDKFDIESDGIADGKIPVSQPDQIKYCHPFQIQILKEFILISRNTEYFIKIRVVHLCKIKG